MKKQEEKENRKSDCKTQLDVNAIPKFFWFIWHVKIVLPQLQNWRDFFAKLVKKSHYTGDFGLVLKRKKEKSPVWGHYNGQYTNKSCNKFPISKEKAITGEKSLIRFLGQDFCFGLLFIMNTIGNPDLKQKWQQHWKGYCKLFIISKGGQCWRKLQGCNNRTAIRLETEKGGWVVSTGPGQKPGLINLEKNTHPHKMSQVRG